MRGKQPAKAAALTPHVTRWPPPLGHGWDSSTQINLRPHSRWEACVSRTKGKSQGRTYHASQIVSLHHTLL